MQLTTIILMIVGTVFVGFIFLATMGFRKKRSFLKGELASLPFQGIILNKQTKTYHGLIGIDERSKKLVLIQTGLTILKTYVINFNDILSCELNTGIGRVSNGSGFGLIKAELKILVKDTSFPSHRFVFYEKNADNYRLAKSLSAQAEHWRDTISVIISMKDEKANQSLNQL